MNLPQLLPHLYPGYAPPGPATEPNLPRVSPELVEVLAARFPNVLPSPTCSFEELRFKQGQVSVVLYLASVCRQQRGGQALEIKDTAFLRPASLKTD